jgi:tetratricopeptide (TPR) repeat protein
MLYFSLIYDVVHLVYRAITKYSLENLAYDASSVIRDLIVILIIFKITRPKKKRTKFKHFHNAAIIAEMEKEYEKALEIRNEGLKLSTLNNEELASLYAGNGGTYLYLKDYNNASLCFDKAFELVQEEEFPYDEQYIEVIDSYVKANRKEDALKLVESLLQRQSYHKKFRKLEPIREKLLT